jgi:hypothetical protein
VCTVRSARCARDGDRGSVANWGCARGVGARGMTRQWRRRPKENLQVRYEPDGRNDGRKRHGRQPRRGREYARRVVMLARRTRRRTVPCGRRERHGRMPRAHFHGKRRPERGRRHESGRNCSAQQQTRQHQGDRQPASVAQLMKPGRHGLSLDSTLAHQYLYFPRGPAEPPDVARRRHDDDAKVPTACNQEVLRSARNANRFE